MKKELFNYMETNPYPPHGEKRACLTARRNAQACQPLHQRFLVLLILWFIQHKPLVYPKHLKGTKLEFTIHRLVSMRKKGNN